MSHAGEADEISLKPDIEDRRSAFRLRAEVLWTWPEPPLIAKRRHSQPVKQHRDLAHRYKGGGSRPLHQERGIMISSHATNRHSSAA